MTGHDARRIGRQCVNTVEGGVHSLQRVQGAEGPVVFDVVVVARGIGSQDHVAARGGHACDPNAWRVSAHQVHADTRHHLRVTIDPADATREIGAHQITQVIRIAQLAELAASGPASGPEGHLRFLNDETRVAERVDVADVIPVEVTEDDMLDALCLDEVLIAGLVGAVGVADGVHCVRGRLGQPYYGIRDDGRQQGAAPPVKRSTDRILTTHVGSLVRPRPIIDAMRARALGNPCDAAAFAAIIEQGVADVVRHQLEIGIDIPNDGEYGRQGYTTYINDRLSGLEPRDLEPDEDVWRGMGVSAERQQFADFFRQYDQHYRFLWMPPEVSLAELDNAPGNAARFRVTGPIGYRPKAVQHDIATLRSALASADLPVADAFITAVTPVGRKSDRGFLDVYPTDAAYLYALADALHAEYAAITDAGFIVQLDYAALNPGTQLLLVDNPNPSAADFAHAREVGVEIVNHALRGIPEERVRYHHCWGSMNTPHTFDTPLRELAPLLLKINAQAYAIEAANPRHEHEWMLWRDLKLPEGKILIPGMVSHQTNVVEHPELIAWRLQNFASVVGKENVIGGTDCGFSQFWDSIRVHPSVQWAKLQALVEGARLASQVLW